MLLKSNVFRIVLSFCLIFCLSLAALADTIRLKDGSVIKGRIVGFRDGQFLVQIGDGTRSRQMSFFADEVADIEFDGGSDSNSSIARTNSAPANTTLPRPSSTPTLNNNDASRQTANNSNNANNVTGKGDANNNSAANTQANLPNNTNSSNNPSQTNSPVNSSSSTTIIPVNNTNNQAANQQQQQQTTSARPKPIQLNIKVLADNTANGWTNAGWVVKKGQKIRITGTGRISLGKGNYSTPAGLSSIADKDKLMQSQPTGGLMAVIGDDNNDFIFIGNSKEFTATRDGALFLGVNEGVLDDNSGSFDVVIEIDPAS